MPIDVNNTDSLVRAMQAQSEANTAASMEAAERQMAFQVAQNAKAFEFNAEQAKLNRDWQERMSNTAHQREIKDLIAAGLNPVLTATGGSGASTPSGSTASGVTSAGAMGQVDTSANAAMSGIVSSTLQTLASMHNAEVSAKAVTDAAGISAAANKYIAQNYPNTTAGIIRELVTGFGGGSLNALASGSAEMLGSFVSSFVQALEKSMNGNNQTKFPSYSEYMKNNNNNDTYTVLEPSEDTEKYPEGYKETTYKKVHLGNSKR